MITPTTPNPSGKTGELHGVVEATHSHTFSHPTIKTGFPAPVVDATHEPLWSEH